MCFHDKPTRNDEIGWGGAPALQDGEEVLHDECGRCQPQVNGTGSVDHHSHHFRLVRRAPGPYYLLVKHGGGEERVDLGYPHTRVAEILALLDSDARYLMLRALYQAHSDATREAREAEASRWKRAAATKSIRTRKVRGRDEVQVWIEEDRTHG